MTKTVLTIDDSRTMRDMLLMALEDAGYVLIAYKNFRYELLIVP